MKPQIIMVILLTGACWGNSQGFVNLDFESANVSGYVPGSVIPASDAFPGWTVNTQPFLTFYDNQSLSGESVSLIDKNYFSNNAIQGNYYALLTSGNYPGTGMPISVGQTGTIPPGTQSILFWGDLGGMQITFSGQSMDFVETGSAAGYNIYAADIAPYAGQTGELLFTVPPYVNGATLDNIQFSPTAVPEPSTWGLTALGGALLACRLRKTPSA